MLTLDCSVPGIVTQARLARYPKERLLTPSQTTNNPFPPFEYVVEGTTHRVGPRENIKVILKNGLADNQLFLFVKPTALKGLKAVLVFANKARRHPGVFSTTAFVFHSLGSPNHFFVSAGSVSEVAILAGLPEDEILPFNQSLDFPEKFNYHPDLRRGSLIGVACERVTPELTWHYHGVGVIAEVGGAGTDWTQLTVYVVPKLHGRHKQPLTFFRPSRETIQALHPGGQLEDLDNDRFRIHTLGFSREFCRGLEVMKVNINQTFVPTETPTEFEMDAFRAAFRDSPLLDLGTRIHHAVYRLDRAWFPEGEYLKVVAGDYAGHAVLPVLEEEHKPPNMPLRPNHVLVALGKYNGTGCLIIPLPIPYLRRHITVMDKVIFRTHLGESSGWVESIDSCTGDFKVRESDSGVDVWLHPDEIQHAPTVLFYHGVEHDIPTQLV